MQQLVERLLPATDASLLAAQRWFAGKARGVREVALDDAAELRASAGAHEPQAVLVIASVRYADGGAERYLLPLVARSRDDTHAGLSIAASDGAESLSEPRDGDGVWRRLVELMAHHAELPGRRGAFRFNSTPELAPLAAPRAGRTAEKRLGGEQSNTAAVVGERFFLKCYRRLDEGLNPEVEILRFLAEQEFASTPPLLGSAVYEPRSGEPAAIALLQARVADAADAWRATVDGVSTWAAAGGRDANLEPLAEDAAAIGRVTAELHAALAARPDRPGFEVRAATRAELEASGASIDRELDGVRRALTGRAAAVDGIEPRIVAALAPLRERRPRTVMRIHGDYHLGQLLRTPGRRFVVIDFEGEPARPLAERRALQSPLRDVAGMLRSFDYAAGTAARELEAAGRAAAAAATARWLAAARTRFTSAYAATIEAASVPLEMDAELLQAFEVQKACYEIRYEAANRPDWLWLPLAGLRALVDPDATALRPAPAPVPSTPGEGG